MAGKGTGGQSPPMAASRPDRVELVPGLTVTRDDAAGTIALSDVHGNRITFGPDGIGIASDMKISIDGTTFEASGSAQAKLTADGPVVIKGATVALNP